MSSVVLLFSSRTKLRANVETPPTNSWCWSSMYQFPQFVSVRNWHESKSVDLVCEAAFENAGSELASALADPSNWATLVEIAPNAMTSGESSLSVSDTMVNKPPSSPAHGGSRGVSANHWLLLYPKTAVSQLSGLERTVHRFHCTPIVQVDSKVHVNDLAGPPHGTSGCA